MIEFQLDETSGVATYLQLVQQVHQALRMGMLEPGDQLPTAQQVVARLAIGPNGAGKTTLLRLAVGLLASTCGTISVLGEDPAAGPAQLARVGFAAQDTPVYARMSVSDHLRLGAWLRDRHLPRRRAGAGRVLLLVGRAALSQHLTDHARVRTTYHPPEHAGHRGVTAAGGQPARPPDKAAIREFFGRLGRTAVHSCAPWCMCVPPCVFPGKDHG
ncbi:MAG: ATP-binding cassette domain-containing protein [Streptosporangiaceae bacterium]|jgi:hypothetical protein